MNLNTLIGRLRITGFLEGVSYLLLFGVTMPLKYMYNQPQPNKIVGMIHGVLFIAYVLLVLAAKIKYKWNFKQMAIALLGSILPFGTFYADAKVFKRYAIT